MGDPLSDTVIEVRDEQGRAISSGTGTIFIGKTIQRVCKTREEGEENTITFR